MIAPDLEDARERFLADLDHVDFEGHQGYLSYWQQVQREASEVEDLGQVDQWARELAKDRDRIEEMHARQQRLASSRPEAGALLEVLRRILSVLDDVERKLRQRLAYLQEFLGFFVRLVGPGLKGKKPKPTDEAAKKAEAEKAAAVQAKKEEPKQPTKTKAP